MTNNRRADPRYSVQKPLVAIPVLADGTPDLEHKMEGGTVDLSRSGIKVDLEIAVDSLPSRSLLVGIPDPRHGGGVRYTGVELVHAEKTPSGHRAAGGRFGGQAQELLSPERRMPVLAPDCQKYVMPTPEPIVRKLADAGVYRSVLLDRVGVCPRCQGLPTFRRGCRACSSGRFVNGNLIHHFACAHVARPVEFEKANPKELTCPKCRSHPLVVGADFEYVPGPYRCLDCHWTDSVLEHIGHCIRCGYRFLEKEATQLELVGYDVDKLDVLDLIPAP